MGSASVKLIFLIYLTMQRIILDVLITCIPPKLNTQKFRKKVFTWKWFWNRTVYKNIHLTLLLPDYMARMVKVFCNPAWQ